MTKEQAFGTDSAVLAQLCAAAAAVAVAEVERMLAVVRWALAHPPATATDAATFALPGGSGQRSMERVPLNEAEVPTVAAWAVAEMAAALGLSAEAGRRLVSEALELAFRLPRIWARLRAGEVEVWRARQVARATVALPGTAADFVDRHLAAVNGTVRYSQIENAVTEAEARFDEERFRRSAAAQRERRHLEVGLSQTSLGGLTPVGGSMDLPDALDLHAAVAHAARQRADRGDAAPLEVRRARALGDIAREHLLRAGQALVGGSVVGIDCDPGAAQPVTILDHAQRRPHWPSADRAPRTARQIMLYVHMSEESVMGQHGLGRVGNTRAPVLVETIKQWCSDDVEGGTRVIVRPVVDTAADVAVDRYEVPDRIAEQVLLRDETCVFPYCARDARGCDLDHIEPYRDGLASQTRPSNLAPLCREHHNLKTQRRWTYGRLPEGGGYEWASQVSGRRYRRDSRGTFGLDDPRIAAGLDEIV
ncbi:MAG: DUF222 domain-containing protein [Beutenbergiaceae bacterium]